MAHLMILIEILLLSLIPSSKVNAQSCTTDACKNGGTCVLYNGNAVCECRPGYGGSDCSAVSCAQSPCQNEGGCIESCSMVNGAQKCTVTCLCRQGFSGDHCQYQFCGTTNIVIGGSAIGSTYYDSNTFQKAFEGPSVMWHSYKSDGATAIMPQWVGYDFGSGRRPRVCQFSLRTRPDNDLGNVPKDGPTAYRFQGTHDDPSASNWIDLFTMTNGPAWQVGELRTHPVGSPKAYRAYRLLVESVPGRSDGSKYAVISNFQMFEDPTDDCINSPCTNGQCNDLLNSYKCSCKQGYAGKTCNLDVDECTGDFNGGCQQICNNLNGGYFCSCNTGFTLSQDAKTCQKDGVPTAGTTKAPSPNPNCKSKIVSVDGRGYSSTTLNGASPDEAFKNGEWHSDEGNGQWIAYIFKDYTSVCKYCFSSRKDNTESNVPYDTPKIFWAEGSNDGISWWPIQDKNHANPPPIFTGPSQEVCYSIPLPQPYLRWRLYVPETPGRPTGVKFTVISNIKLIGEDEVVTLPTVTPVPGSCGTKNVADLSNGATVSATSVLYDNYPENAFKGPEYEWHSQDKPPQSLIYDFKTQKTICYVTFLPRKDNAEGNVQKDCPQSWTFDGSNDGTNWENLLYIPTEVPCAENVKIQQAIPKQKPFRMYRIRTLQVPGRLSGNRFVVLRDVQMFETTATVPTVSTQATVSTISTVKTSPASVSTASTVTTPSTKCIYNIATNPKAAAASSALTGSEASNAFEPLEKQREWHSEKGVPQWISYTTYTTPVRVCRYAFFPRIDNTIGNSPKDCPKSYTIQGSNNNAFWYNIAVIKDAGECIHNQEISGNLNNLNKFLTYRILVNDVPGRGGDDKFVVIRGVKFYTESPVVTTAASTSASSPTTKASTIASTIEPSTEVPSTIAPTPTPRCDIDSKNYATGGAAFASSFFPTNEPVNGFSGDKKEWGSKKGMPQHLGYNLATAATICSISFLPRMDNSFGNVPNDCPKDYDIEASNDNFASETKVLNSVRNAPACAPNVIVTVAFDNKTPYKQYRVHIKDVKGRSDGKKFAVIRDLRFFGSLPVVCTGQSNIAVNGEATSSSALVGAEAQKGFAGKESEWNSAQGMPQSITYKLKEKAVVCKVSFLPRKDNSMGNVPRDCPKNLGIEGSHDGSSFVLIKRVEGLPACEEGKEIVTLLSNDASYLYYRILVETVPGRADGKKFVVLRDIQMFGTTATATPSTVAPAPTCKGVVNRAKGGKASASTELISTHGAAMAFDGPQKEWHSKAGVPQWLMYELIDPSPICKISFLPRMDNSAGNVPKDCPKSYKFEGSNDGTTFETILSVTDQNPCVADAILTKSFANEKAFKFYRFMVLDVPGRDAAKYVILRDLRFFGNDDSIPCSKGNLATDGTAVASSEIIENSAAVKAFSGPAESWHSKEGMPQSISYTLKEAKVACSISFLPRPDNSAGNAVPDCPKNFDIYGIDASTSNAKLLKQVVDNKCVFRNRVEVGLVNYLPYKTYKISVGDVAGRTDGKKFVVISDIQIHGADPCAPNPCNGGNGGTCAKDAAVTKGYKCTCPSGYEGANCENNIANFDCNKTPCKNEGTCGTDKKCACKTGFKGNQCETAICDASMCSGNGECSVLSVGGVTNVKCKCKDGFTGDKCATASCSPNPCKNEGTCTVDANKPKCTCVNGYTGDLCATPPPKCNPNPCKNRGACAEKDGKAVCTCKIGWKGDTCETAENQCTKKPCQNEGICIPNQLSSKGYLCNCHAGYSGATCETAITSPVNCVGKDAGDYSDNVCPSNVYYTCQGNKGWLRRCNPQLVYSAAKNQCVWPQELACS